MSEYSSLLGDSFSQHQSGKFDIMADNKLKRKGQRILEKYKPKKSTSTNHYLHIIFWMLAAIATFHYTDFYVALRVDTRIHRIYLYLGLALVFTSVLIAIVMIGYYHYYKGISDYEVQFPYAIPAATVLFLTGMVVMCVALWPVWNVFTPVILVTMFMGTIFALSILPL